MPKTLANQPSSSTDPTAQITQNLMLNAFFMPALRDIMLNVE